MKKFLSILLLSSIALTLVACTTIGASEGTPEVTTIEETTDVILDGIDAIAAQLEPFMTYEDVCDTLGFEGKKIDVGEVYEWEYENGDSILVDFGYMNHNYDVLVMWAYPFVEKNGDTKDNAYRMAAKLTNGMNYEEISEILGVEGKIFGSGKIEYIFQIDDNNAIIVTMEFSNGNDSKCVSCQITPNVGLDLSN